MPEWEKLTTDNRVLSAISGYKIPFTSVPPTRATLNEPTFSSEVAKSCDQELIRLLNKGAINIVEKSTDQFLSSFFIRVKPSGGVRFILNLKELNKYLDPPHFKLEDWRTVVRLMLPNYFMASIDLEDAYFLISIQKDHRKFLRVQWRNVTYEFSSLLFGLSTAPYIFTKILRPVFSFLREKGLQSVTDLDDFLLFGSSYEECKINIECTIQFLQYLGLVINFKKSSLIPALSCKYLGLIFNSQDLSLSIPKERRAKLLDLILSPCLINRNVQSKILRV